MSLTFTLSEKIIVLAANYFPFINLNNGDYELNLAIFETYHNDTERERIEQQILFRQRRRGNYNSQGFVQSARYINEFWNARFYGNVRIMRLKALT